MKTVVDGTEKLLIPADIFFFIIKLDSFFGSIDKLKKHIWWLKMAVLAVFWQPNPPPLAMHHFQVHSEDVLEL